MPATTTPPQQRVSSSGFKIRQLIKLSKSSKVKIQNSKFLIFVQTAPCAIPTPLHWTSGTLAPTVAQRGENDNDNDYHYGNSNEVGDVTLLRNLNIVQQLYLGGEEEEDEGQTEREEEH